MPTIKITQRDIKEMVSMAVCSILNESVDEVQGSIMAEKDDVIQAIVNYVKKEWDEIKENGTKPKVTDRYTFDNGQGIKFDGVQNFYPIYIPFSISEMLGISEKFIINVGVWDYNIPKDKVKYFSGSEKATEGTSYGGPQFSKLSKTTLKVSESRIDMYVPSFNGELQTTGFHSTLYHELNHSGGRLELLKKHMGLDDDELSNLNYFTASRRKYDSPHALTYSAMHPSKENKIVDMLCGITDKEAKERRSLAYVFYALWETTERNARAEAIYGELKEFGATRENFKDIYPQTELYRQIQELKDIVNKSEEIEIPSIVWIFAGKVMNMSFRGKNKKQTRAAFNRYQEAVKERFLSRSRELLDILFKKAMKIAELYFQRKEDKERKKINVVVWNNSREF